MAGVLCVWSADLTDASEQWYENEYIPSLVSRHSDRVLLSEIVATPLDKDLEGVATNDASWKHLAVYEFDDVQKMQDATYDESNHPSMEGPLKGSRFDVRTYQEIKTWQNDEEWNGGTTSPTPRDTVAQSSAEKNANVHQIQKTLPRCWSLSGSLDQGAKRR
jgi:hypothetical protein